MKKKEDHVHYAFFDGDLATLFLNATCQKVRLATIPTNPRNSEDKIQSAQSKYRSCYIEGQQLKMTKRFSLQIKTIWLNRFDLQ